MGFKKIAALANYISKDYAEEVFGLLMSHHDISASEAASRLDLHIRTVQEFLEVMASYDILSKKEVYERKRPYYRYALKKKKIEITVDLDEIFSTNPDTTVDFKIREAKNSGANFSLARYGQYFSTISYWKGSGREGKQRTINLTLAQGEFLYYLPFPDAKALSIEEILEKSKVKEEFLPEIQDIIDELIALGIIEKVSI